MHLSSDILLRVAAHIHPVGRVADLSNFVNAGHFPSVSEEADARDQDTCNTARLALEGASMAGFCAHQLTLGKIEQALPLAFALRDWCIDLTGSSPRSPRASLRPFVSESPPLPLSSVASCLHECLVGLPFASIYLGVTLALWVPTLIGAAAGALTSVCLTPGRKNLLIRQHQD